MELLDGLLCMAAFGLHIVRRLYECIFVHDRASAARMHLAHYAFGLSFYSVAVPTLSPLGSPHTLRWLQTARGGGGGTGALLAAAGGASPATWLRRAAGLVLVGYGSLHQHRCHKILAALRSPPQVAVGVKVI